jgi:hypothetical protein
LKIRGGRRGFFERDTAVVSEAGAELEWSIVYRDAHTCIDAILIRWDGHLMTLYLEGQTGRRYPITVIASPVSIAVPRWKLSTQISLLTVFTRGRAREETVISEITLTRRGHEALVGQTITVIIDPITGVVARRDEGGWDTLIERLFSVDTAWGHRGATGSESTELDRADIVIIDLSITVIIDPITGRILWAQR